VDGANRSKHVDDTTTASSKHIDIPNSYNQIDISSSKTQMDISTPNIHTSTQNPESKLPDSTMSTNTDNDITYYPAPSWSTLNDTDPSTNIYIIFFAVWLYFFFTIVLVILKYCKNNQHYSPALQLETFSITQDETIFQQQPCPASTITYINSNLNADLRPLPPSTATVTSSNSNCCQTIKNLFNTNQT
jgi:hypothetical protein